MRSIRRHLTWSLLGGAVAAFGIAGVVLHARVSDALLAQFDGGLSARVRALGSLLERDGPYVEFNYTEGVMPRYEGGTDPEYFVLWLPDGTVAKRSDSLGDETLPRRSGSVSAPVFWDLPLPDGRAGRAVGIEVSIGAPGDARDGEGDGSVADADDDEDAGDDEDDDEILGGAIDASSGEGASAPVPHMTIVVAASREPLDESLAALLGGLGIAAGIALVLMFWGVAVSIRRGLTPIGELSAQVEAIDAASLSLRVESMGVPVELSPFADKLNELLRRLEESFAKERRMTAAMAHELRTPIAELRAASDVARRWPDDRAMADEVLAAAADVAARMSSTVDAVMRYCRLEVGQAELEVERFPLRDLLDELWRPLQRAAQERGLVFVNEVAPETEVFSDRGLLSIVFRNLLGNAASFAALGNVRVWATRDGGDHSVHVCNATDQLQPEDVERMTEPFWRKDAARTEAAHSGLGLTLVVSIADALGGSVRILLRGRDLDVSVGIPRRPPDSRVVSPRPGAATAPVRRTRGTITQP